MTAHAEMTTDTTNAVTVTTGRDVSWPLNKLYISAENMTSKRDEGYIRSLAAMIEAQGLMHRLSITIDADGKGAVHAGGNRLLALQLLQSQGKLAVDEPIECKAYEDAERAVALSLTENLARQLVHPADEFEAFAKLAKQGLTVAKIATQFGVSQLTVERRLALAKLAPRFITMLRDGKATLDQLMALSLATNHKQQIAVWDSIHESARTKHNITKKIVQAEVHITAKVARFVGLEAYKAAGGKLRNDLFGDEGDCWLVDSVLLNELAEKKLIEAMEAEKAAGWSWAEFKESIGWYDLNSYERETAKSRKPTAEEAAGIAEVTELIDSVRNGIYPLESAYQKTPAGSPEEAQAEAPWRAAKDQLNHLEQHLREMRETLLQWSPSQLSTCGVVVSIDEDGELTYVRGLMKQEDKKAIKKAKIAELKKQGKEIPASLQSTGSGPRAAFSERLMHDLTAHRTAAMQAALKDNHHVALALVVHTMLVPILAAHSHMSTPLKLRLELTRRTQLDTRASDYKASPAAIALNQALEQWGERVPGKVPVALYQWLLTQESAVLIELLAFCAANGLDAMHGREREQYDMSDALADSLNLDMADWWTPTEAKYLTSVSKAQLIEAVTEAETAEIARPMEKMPKGEAVKYAAAKLEGKRWLPAPLKRKTAPTAEALAAEHADEDYDIEDEQDDEDEEASE